MGREMKKPRRQCYISTIPDYILLWLIFLRLPARSVVAVRSVCKSWRSLASSPSFVLSHVRRARSRARTSIVFESEISYPQWDRGRWELALFYANLSERDAKRVVVVEKETIPDELLLYGPVCYQLHVLASCDGLLCLDGDYFTRDQDYVVCNPVTKEWLDVPRSFHNTEFILALYFHRPTGEYRLLQQYTDGYAVFSIGGSNKVWRPLEDVFYDSWEGQPISVHGSVHWLPFHDDRSIVAFDTTSEKFRRMSISRQHRQGYRHSLIEFGGSLGLCRGNKDEMDIWCLKDYTKEEWIKQYTISVDYIRTSVYKGGRSNSFCTPLVAWDDGKELLLQFDKGCFVLYNLESNTFAKQRMNNKLRQISAFWLHHIDTLVSLNSLKVRQDTYRD